MQYSELEHSIARYLNRFPKTKQLAKQTYQRAMIQLMPPQSCLWVKDEVNVIPLQSNKYELFFGYYGKSPWNSDGRYYLIHRIFNRDMVDICVVDLLSGKIKVLDRTPAFNLQQGAMLQWFDDSTCLYNTVVDGKLCAVCTNIYNGERLKTLPCPIYELQPTRREALTVNFCRLARSGEYGYSIQVKNFNPDMPEDEDGMWQVDLNSGNVKILISIRKLIEHNFVSSMNRARHEINHILYDSSGRHFVFMHRWVGPKGRYSRLFSMDSDGKEMKCIADGGMISHYCWRDNAHLLAWARHRPWGDKYYLYNIETECIEVLADGVLEEDGHPSYSPDGRWIVTDTYPDRRRMQSLILYDTWTNHAIVVARFFSPFQFEGPNRCDLHPRWCPDGKKVSIDSGHTGMRMSYIVDISKIVEEA